MITHEIRKSSLGLNVAITKLCGSLLLKALKLLWRGNNIRYPLDRIRADTASLSIFPASS